MRTTNITKLQQVDADIRVFFTSLKYRLIDTDTLLHTGMSVDIQCEECSTVLQHQRISKFQYIYKHYGTRACPACKLISQNIARVQRIQLFITRLEQDTSLRLVDHNMLPQTNTDKHLYLSTTCGHTFLSTIDNIKANNPTVCSTCSRLYAHNKIRKTYKVKSIATKILTPTLSGYAREVRAITESTYRQHKSRINPSNHQRSHAKHKTGYQLDHIIPVRLGYELRLSPDIIGGVDNLQMLDWETNIKVQEFLDRKIRLVPNTKQQIHQLCVQYPHVAFDGANITLTREYLDSDYYLNFPFLEFTASNKNKRLTHQQFVDRVAVKSPTIAIIGQYVNSVSKTEVECTVCNHLWAAQSGDLMRGRGCPICARSSKVKNV